VKSFPHFLNADGKGNGLLITSKFYSLLLFTFVAHFYSQSSEN